MTALDARPVLDLAERLAALLGGTVTGLDRMVGGASRETWSFELDGRPLVLRRDPSSGASTEAMAREAVLMRAAAAAGVPVPEVVAAGDDLGGPYVVMSRLHGETIARRILRDERYAAARSVLVGQCAQALARLHRGVRPADVPGLPAGDAVAAARAELDGGDEAHPAFELALRWLEEHRPEPSGTGVVHGDFRLGNLMVGPNGLVGVLDWELTHVGDPVEDLGWLCVRSWRFGGRQPVAGLGDYEELLSAYGRAGGVRVRPATLWWWEVLGTLRWGVICIRQARTHLSGQVRSVELAAIGRRVCEVELDLLDLLPGRPPPYVPEPYVPEPVPVPDPGPHDRPTAAELLTAVRELLDGDVTAALSGHTRFLVRVASRSLAQVEREITRGPAQAVAHAARLARLGVADDAELAAGIRSGRFDPAAVTADVRAAVVAKLEVADPAQLQSR